MTPFSLNSPPISQHTTKSRIRDLKESFELNIDRKAGKAFNEIFNFFIFCCSIIFVLKKLVAKVSHLNINLKPFKIEFVNSMPKFLQFFLI